jgi:hypothetical protein
MSTLRLNAVVASAKNSIYKQTTDLVLISSQNGDIPGRLIIEGGFARNAVSGVGGEV